MASTLRELARPAPSLMPPACTDTGAFLVGLWRDRPLRHVLAGLILLWLCGSSNSAWMASFLIRNHGLALTSVGLVMTGSAGLAGLLGNFLSGTLVQRITGGDEERLALTAAACALLYFPSGLITLLAPGPRVVVGSFFGQSVVYFMIFASCYGLTMGLAEPAIRARTAAVISMGATVIGFGLGPQIVSLMSEALRLALVAMLLVIGWSRLHFMLAGLALRRHAVRRGHEPWRRSRAARPCASGDHAVLSLPKPHLGLAPLAGGPHRLARAVGENRAMSLLLTGARLAAAEGASAWLRSRGGAPGGLMATALALAETIGALSPAAIRACKELVVRGGAEPSVAAAMQAKGGWPAVQAMIAGGDRNEGVLAFSEKRPPRWTI